MDFISLILMYSKKKFDPIKLVSLTAHDSLVTALRVICWGLYIIIIITRHEVGLDRHVSAQSNSLFKVLLSLLCQFVLQFSIFWLPVVNSCHMPQPIQFVSSQFLFSWFCFQLLQNFFIYFLVKKGRKWLFISIFSSRLMSVKLTLLSANHYIILSTLWLLSNLICKRRQHWIDFATLHCFAKPVTKPQSRNEDYRGNAYKLAPIGSNVCSARTRVRSHFSTQKTSRKCARQLTYSRFR